MFIEDLFIITKAENTSHIPQLVERVTCGRSTQWPTP